MMEADQPDIDMEVQLSELYREKAMLHQELGVSNAEDIIEMIHSLESQLLDFYQQKSIEETESIDIQIEGDRLIIYGPKSISVRKRAV